MIVDRKGRERKGEGERKWFGLSSDNEYRKEGGRKGGKERGRKKGRRKEGGRKGMRKEGGMKEKREGGIEGYCFTVLSSHRIYWKRGCWG